MKRLNLKEINTQRIIVEVNPDLKEIFEKAVKEAGHTRSTVLRQLIKNYIEKTNRQKKVTNKGDKA